MSEKMTDDIALGDSIVCTDPNAAESEDQELGTVNNMIARAMRRLAIETHVAQGSSEIEAPSGVLSSCDYVG
jgi:hypothetical protein